MLYKEKILLLHRNSLLQERLATYLREQGFAVIMANNVDTTLSLVESMKPDLVLWGGTLTAHSKSILQGINKGNNGTGLPVIALIPDMELFDRIEIEKSGVNDIMDAVPNFSELKVKIRFHLLNRKKIKHYEDEVQHFTDLSELQYNLIRVQDVNRLCELVNDFIFNAYKPESLITVVFNKKTGNFDYKGITTAEPPINDARESIFDLPIWKKYLFAKAHPEAEQIVDNYLIEFFSTINLGGDFYYQFPLRAAQNQTGFIICGFKGNQELNKKEFDELNTLAQSLAFRIINNRRLLTGTVRDSEATSEIQQFFKLLNEDEISDYLSLQLLNHLKADVCIYFNYNEGFRFLYPQHCYRKGSEVNLFENEKPPVLMLADYPTFDKFMEGNLPSAHFNLNQVQVDDLKRMAALAGGDYQSILIFAVQIGNEKKGFFIVANTLSRQKFTNKEIQDAEQIIHKATNVLVESRLVKQAQKTIKQLDRVFELGKELTLNLDVNELLRKIAHAVRRSLGWNIVILERRNLGSKQYQNICALGLQPEEYQKLHQKYTDSLFGNDRPNCYKISNSYFCDHETIDEPVNDLMQRRFVSSIGKEWNDEDWLIVPILSKGQELGYFAVNDPVERVRPSEEKVRNLEYFANQAAIALENAFLYRQVKTSEQKYRLLAETMTMGLVTFDFSGKIEYVNKSLVQMLKRKEQQEIAGKSIFDLCSPKSRSDAEKYILKLLSQSNESQINEGVEIELLCNLDQHIPFKLFASIQNPLAKKPGFMGVLADLRPQRKLERLKTDFNSMVVHDLRSPLNIIQGYIDIVRNNVVGQISEEQGELLSIAKENVDKVLRLIDNFMIASKIDSGKFDMEFEINSINALIESVAEHNRILANDKEIEVELNLDDAISLQQFDKLRIEQVLNNYLSNAIKFTQKGGNIFVSSKLVKGINELTREDTMDVHVAVRDTGVGISYEEQKKVFSKYEQTEAGKDATLKGTGLGLAICKEIISLHEGEVWLESKAGEGSTFFFSLPITQIRI